MGTRGLSLGEKRPGRETDHSPLSSAKIKECVELYLHFQYAFMAWCLVESTWVTLTLPFTLFFIVVEEKVSHSVELMVL
jgi:hypothetical protein